MLKKAHKISYYTFFNGNLKVKKEDGDFHYIEHVADLSELIGMDREKIEHLCDRKEEVIPTTLFDDDSM